jgi:FKBP-type peptidyl-prolyl cis-trans isomerase
MKKYFAFAFCFLLIGFANAQKPVPKKVVPKTKTTTSTPVLKNEMDSLSYAIGLSVANFYRQQGIKLNTTLVTKACNDVLTSKKPLLTDEQANLLFMCHSNPTLCAHVKEDEKFLAGNKKNPNVKLTSSGLQYEVITQGTGIRPNATDTVTVNYKGTLTNGTEFDNSYKRGEPISFALDHVIRGWTEGLQLMTVGSKYKFYIPYQLGYGLNEMGTIPAGSALVFEVELLDVKKPK